VKADSDSIRSSFGSEKRMSTDDVPIIKTLQVAYYIPRYDGILVESAMPS
jgi:hypothetical protein